MTQLIDKDALVAEIERRTDELWALIPDSEKVFGDKHTKEDAFNLGKYTALESLDKFIDILEVKEVQDLLDDMEEDKELKGKTAQEIVNRIHWKGCDGAIEALGLLVKSYKQYCKAHNLQREQVSMRWKV